MKILSIQTKKLSPDKINKIINLKATHYKFKKKLQLLWFNNNIKKTDIHNILIHNNEIIGYNCLRKINRSYAERFQKSMLKIANS